MGLLQIISSLIPRKIYHILIDFDDKIHTINPIFIARLGLLTWRTAIDAQKIDDSPLVTYSMAIVDFSL